VPHSQVVADHQVTSSANNTPYKDTYKKSNDRGDKIFCSYKYHKIENNLNFELAKKKIWANLQRIIELFSQKIVFEFSKI
jgi:hypothetical protein